MDIADRGETGTGGSGDSAGRPPLLGRKSMLMGLLTSGFVIAGATRPSAAAAETVKPTAPATAKPLADTQAPSAPLWTPSTDYALGQQVISPHNDVVSANVGHTSSADYATDTANWTLSSTFSGKATETTVTSGRLSQASLAGAYAQVINIVGPGIDATGATRRSSRCSVLLHPGRSSTCLLAPIRRLG